MSKISPCNDDDARSLAIDPQRSVIVQAPAGSGKTTLLVHRYLELLGRVEEPEHVLAITFTRKAAAEMRQRVLEQLRLKTDVARRANVRASERDWHLLDNPQRLRIQTIDSYALSILQQQPFSSRFGLEFRFVEDARWLYTEAADRLLEKTADKDPLSADISRFVALLGNDFDLARNLIADMLSRRDQWLDPVSNVARDTTTSHPEQFVQLIESAIKSITDRTTNTLSNSIPQQLLKEMNELCAFSARNLEQPFSHLSDFHDWRFFSRIATTQNGSFRQRLTVREGFPSKAQSEKARVRDVIGSLASLGLMKPIANLQHMPDEKIPQEEREKLVIFSIVLTLAAVELIEVFRLHQLVDFSELTISARNALSRDEMPTDLALMLDYRTFHILVDEFQDTSLAQYKLLTSLVQGWQPGDGNTFFAVGDPMQSIYRFRDADLNLYQTTFNQGLPSIPLDAVQLTSNFRSAASLVAWTNDIFSTLFEAPEDALTGAVQFNPAVATREESGHIHAFVANDTESEAKNIVERIGTIRSEHPNDTIAILVRSRNVLAPIIEALQEAKLQWRGIDLEPLANVPVVRDLYAITLALMDERNRLAWLSIFRSPLVGIRLCDLEIVAHSRTAADMLTVTGVSADARGRLDRVVRAQKIARAGRSIRSVVERFWLAMGGADAYADSDRATAMFDSADRYLEILENQPTNRIFADQLFAQIQRLFASTSIDTVDVEIMTIHRAKGLEFNHVIVPGLARGTQSNIRPMLLWRPEADALLVATRDNSRTNSLYNWLRYEEAEKDSQELKRLLYVAATRAKDSLSLYGCQTEDSNPPRGSFMALLQPLISFQSVDSTSERPTKTSFASRPPLKRLKSEYVWQEPFLPPIQPSSFQTLPSLNITDAIADRKEVVLGNVVHHELRLLARSNEGALVNLGLWYEKLIGQGLDEREVVWILEHARKQLDSVLADDTGAWMLNASHKESHTEWMLTTYQDSQFKNVVIDRSFVDASGDRWLIDYKAAVPDKPTAFF
ncbi:MAG: UvrD-helicase domain-containing protein, partial [Pseudomonadales bacterium]